MKRTLVWADTSPKKVRGRAIRNEGDLWPAA
jgi:hypothetical protein